MQDGPGKPGDPGSVFLKMKSVKSRSSDVLKLITDLFYSMMDHASLESEIGIIKDCLAKSVPFDRVDLDVEGMINEFLSRDSFEYRLEFKVDIAADQLNSRLKSLEVKAVAE